MLENEDTNILKEFDIPTLKKMREFLRLKADMHEKRAKEESGSPDDVVIFGEMVRLCLLIDPVILSKS